MPRSPGGVARSAYFWLCFAGALGSLIESLVPEKIELACGAGGVGVDSVEIGATR